MAPKESLKTLHPSTAFSSSYPWKSYGIKLRSKEEGHRFFYLTNKELVSTKFVCRETTVELGITRNVDLLASKLGWDGPNGFIYKANPSFWSFLPCVLRRIKEGLGF